jgi:NDP-4-keto-2,6-dideoxyhexose 3-C-methyltransferase
LTARPLFHAIDACRVCGSTDLHEVLSLGEQSLTGVFPRPSDLEPTMAHQVARAPLEVVKCVGGYDVCGLVQLRHSYDPHELYGAHYGYRSALNRSMVAHLRGKVKALLTRRPIGAGDAVLDIGSNDGTTLSFYPRDVRLFGIDPTAAKFAKYYEPHVSVVAEFFSAGAFLRASGGKRARIVTSIAMFYDLERPLDFMSQVHDVLADDGIWHVEQSYLPAMLAAGSYDTVCHEHLEYYALTSFVWMADRVGFSIVEVSFNAINGGSFAVTATKAAPGKARHAPVVAEILDAERKADLGSLVPYARFAADAARHKRELRATLSTLNTDGKRVLGLGASTKGNVILQYCEIGTDLLPCIGEVNDEKFGCVTPGTHIPIVSENELLARSPDVLLVLPWHFRHDIVRRSAPLFNRGIRLLFPLPKIEFVPAEAGIR